MSKINFNIFKGSSTKIDSVVVDMTIMIMMVPMNTGN